MEMFLNTMAYLNSLGIINIFHVLTFLLLAIHIYMYAYSYTCVYAYIYINQLNLQFH